MVQDQITEMVGNQITQGPASQCKEELGFILRVTEAISGF